MTITSETQEPAMSGWQPHDSEPERQTPPPAGVPTAALPAPGGSPSHTRRNEHGTPGQRRRRWLGMGVAVLGLAVLASAALATYLWQTTDEWMAESDRLETVATELATERDALAGDLDQAQRDLAATEQQLREAQDRITALADEKAQTADEREVARQVAGNVAGVANQLEVCVRGQDQLITALEDVEAYDPASVSAFAREVSDACTQALEGSEEIKRQLGIE